MKDNGKTKQQNRGRKPGGNIAGPIITGDLLLLLKRWYPLALYCCVLIFVYILCNFGYQRLQREEIALRLELNRDRSRAVVFSSIRMNNSRPSYIMEQVKRRGIQLEESEKPPKKLVRYE